MMINPLRHPSVKRLRALAKTKGIPARVLLARHFAAKRRNPTLGLSDFLNYALYEGTIGVDVHPEDYVAGSLQTELAYALNPREGVLPAWDKLTFHLHAQAFELPAPPIRAVFRKGAQGMGSLAPRVFTSTDELGAWLRGQADWPVFAKPSFSQQGIGAYHFTAYDATTDTLATHSGMTVPVEQFLREVGGGVPKRYFRPEMGYLFQEVLRPHPEIVQLVGSTQISGVRVVLVQDAAGSEIVTALWKVAGDEAETDRYVKGAVRAFLADVDPRTGRLRVAKGAGGRLVRAPMTDREVEGFVLPDWQAAISLCHRAAAVFPMMRIQHWDVAMTDRGPVLLELNDIGAIIPAQQFGHGLLTERFRELLRQGVDPVQHPWVKALVR